MLFGQRVWLDDGFLDLGRCAEVAATPDKGARRGCGCGDDGKRGAALIDRKWEDLRSGALAARVLE